MVHIVQHHWRLASWRGGFYFCKLSKQNAKVTESNAQHVLSTAAGVIVQAI